MSSEQSEELSQWQWQEEYVENESSMSTFIVTASKTVASHTHKMYLASNKP